MDLILFLLLIVMTIIISYKLAYYIDTLNQITNLGDMIIGSLLLASITSLPLFIVNLFNLTTNPCLVMENILSNNIFNFAVIAFFDLLCVKYRFMDKISSNYLGPNLILIYIYVVIIAYFQGNLLGNIANIGIPSIIIFIIFLIYIMLIFKNEDDKPKINIKIVENYINFKLLISVILLTISLILIYYINSKSLFFSNILIISIIINLPKIILFYYFININNYNLAYANIIGSNIFNFIFLVIIDLIFSNNIYDFYNQISLKLAYIGLWLTIILIYPIMREKSLFKLTYLLPSICIIIASTIIFK